MAYNDIMQGFRGDNAMAAAASATEKMMSNWGSRRKSVFDSEFWQVKVFYNRQIEVKGLLKKKRVAAPFEFASEMINRTKDEAIGYIPYYIASLIKNGDLPSSAIANGKINEDIIGVRVVKLDIALMERNVEDK